MIQTDKTYKTADGRKARVAFIEGKVAHVHIEDLNVSEELKAIGAGWMPMLMDAETGYPYNVQLESDWAKNNLLIESKPTKQISHTLYVLKDGSCVSAYGRTAADLHKLVPFAELTINAEVEEGSNRVVTV